MDLIDFSDLFTTKAEANEFLSRLATVTEGLFQTNFNLARALTEQFGINKSDRFIAILRQSNINPESLPAVKTFLTELATKVASIPVLSLTVAFEPKEQTLKMLSEWFLLNMKRHMLFEITVDRSLVAGASITYNGKFFDFSIRRTFERILQAYLTRLAAAGAQVQVKPAVPQQTAQPVNTVQAPK